MSIGIEQLDLVSIDTRLTTDAELQALVGVTKNVILEKLSSLTELELKNLGIPKYVHPDYHTPDIILQDSNHRFVTDLEKEKYSNVYSKNQIDNIMRTVTTSLIWSEAVDSISDLSSVYTNPSNGTTVQIKSTGEVFSFDASESKWVKILSSFVPMATKTVAGLMSPEMVTKLDTVESGANKYVHPETHSADMIEDSSSKVVMTVEERNKLRNIDPGANQYIHPTSHPASIIETDPERRFISDQEKVRYGDKYSKVEIDNKLSGIVSNLIWKKQVQTYQDLFLNYPNPQAGWCVNVVSESTTYRWNGTQWEATLSSYVPLASETEDGRLTSLDYIKLQSIEAGAKKHPEGDGSYHVPAIGSNKKHFTLAAGAIGVKEQRIIHVDNKVTASGTFGVRVTDSTLNELLRIKVVAGEVAESVARKIESAVKLNSNISNLYTVKIDPTKPEQVILTAKEEALRNLQVKYINIPTEIRATTKEKVAGVVPSLEVFTLSITSYATSNGYLTLYLNNGGTTINNHPAYTVDVSVASGDSPQIIAAKIRNAILTRTTYHAEVQGDVVIVTAPLAGNEIDAAIVETNGVTGKIIVTTQGTTGVAEENVITVESAAGEYGTLGITFNDGTLNKTFNVLCEKGETAPAIATKIRRELISDVDLVNAYLVVVKPDKPYEVSITKKVNENVITLISITDTFTGVGGDIETSAVGVDRLPTYWRKPLSINGKVEGDILGSDVVEVLKDSKLVKDLSELRLWQLDLEQNLNKEEDKDFVTTLNDVITKLDGLPLEKGIISSKFEEIYKALGGEGSNKLSETINNVENVIIPKLNNYDNLIEATNKSVGDVVKAIVEEVNPSLQAVSSIATDNQEQINNLKIWKDGLERNNFDGKLNTIKELYDFVDGVAEGKTLKDLVLEVSKVKTYMSNFNGPTGQVITHDLNTSNYTVTFTPTENPDGRLGEVWVVKEANKFTIYNSGSFKGTLDLQVVLVK